MLPPAEFYISGVKITAIGVSDLLQIVDCFIQKGKKEYVVLTGAHGIVEMQRDEELRKINNAAAIVTPDGMPVVWIGMLKGHKNIEKVYAVNIMNALFLHGIKNNYKHFFFGGAEGVADMLKTKLETKYPGISVVGNYCPPFRPLREAEVYSIQKIINYSEPHIVWVGLGCPKQEKWMHQFRPLLNAPVLIGVGAGFDFYSDRIPIAPEWIQHSGFEWLFRIFYDPKRLVMRYSRIIPKFIYYAAKDILLGVKTRISRNA